MGANNETGAWATLSPKPRKPGRHPDAPTRFRVLWSSGLSGILSAVENTRLLADRFPLLSLKACAVCLGGVLPLPESLSLGLV